MKLKNLFLGSFALTAMLFAQSCEDKNDGPTGAPSIELSTQTLDFEKDGGSQTIKLTATRDWNVTNVPDWIAVDPKSGNPAENKEVIVTVLENTGMDRSQDIKFTIGFDAKTLTVNQKGTGSAAEVVVYHNDFDKELAVKGSSGWTTYLDKFDGWKNETGSGISTVEYASSGMSARTTSSGTSNSQFSDYQGSGKNYLWFAKDNYFHVKNITLPEGKTNYTISFGSERNLYEASDNTFVPTEFLVYISNDGSKWVELKYEFPNGLKNRRWDLASSTFTVPSGTKSLHIYIKATLASAYLMDDLDLSVAASAGTVIDFSKGIDLGTGGSTGGGDTPAPTGNNIAAVCAAAAGSAADLKDVLVTGVTTQSYVITDETGSVLVFVKADPKVKVGDKVNVAGTTGEHNGLIQITAPTTTVVSSNNTVTYPAPLEFTEANLADTPKKVTYVSFTGNVKKNNQYYNIYIGSVTDKDLSLSYYTGNMDEFVDCDIKVKGWYVGGGTHYQIVATEVEKVETTGPKFSVSTTALTAKAGDTSASFDVKGNVKWTVSSDNAAYTVSPASGDGAGTVTVKFAANETENDVTVNLTVSTTEEVATKSYTVVLTHKGKSAAGEGETKTITIATDNAWPADNHKDYGAGFSFTKDGVKYGYYKSTSSNDAIAPKDDHIRVYKNSVLVIVPPAGKAITSVVIDTNHYSDKCTDMTVLTDNDSTTNTAKADTKKWTISWEGNVSTFAAKAVNSQVQIKSITVTLK
ncbi:MAG: hypothetical protein MR502_01055 [Bacteroides sp.]|nr:hypothetical protein [Bacteroides sp.]